MTSTGFGAALAERRKLLRPGRCPEIERVGMLRISPAVMLAAVIVVWAVLMVAVFWN